jgi:Phage portal protein
MSRNKINKVTDTYTVNLAEVKIPEINPNQVRMSPNKWVFYGESNLFPDFLMKSVKKSTNHSAFISLRENMIKGAGITYSDNIKDFLENLDEEGQTVEDIIEDIANDLSILETFAIAVRYNKTKDKIIYLDYIDSSKVRPAKIEQTPEEIANGVLPAIQGYWVSADWSNVNVNTPRYYEKFNPNDVNDTTQLFFYHKRANGQPYLPEISYASALNYIEMEYQMSKYGLNSMLNGFFASAIIEVNASLSEEQKHKLRADFTTNFQGTDNASKLMVVVSEMGGSIKVTPISTGDNTNMLKALEDMAEAAICTAHRGQPVLAGIQSTGSTLGSDGKLIKTAQELFYNNVIVHLQKPILSFLKKVFRFNGVTEYQLDIQSLNLVSEDVPDWFLQDFVKPEVLAAKYGFKAEDLITTTPLATPDAPLLDGEAA